MSVCRYDCAENRTAEAIPAYPDISGIGVVAGYTATAGFAVIIIIGYYFFAHIPELDPFRSDDDDNDERNRIKHRTNPVDKMVLGYTRRWSQKTPDANVMAPAKKYLGLEKALLKCVLTMSDLQILTGLSILASGFSQLRCGLSVYHWQVTVYLAWFCSLTHLSCLTVLRNHLYNHPGERLWRLIGMGILVAMLVVALLPTGNFGGSTDPAEYAICKFRNLGPAEDIGGSPTSQTRDDPYFAFMGMIISILLVVLGFFSRVIRLHRNLNITLVTRSRRYLSERARQFLRKLYERLERQLNETSAIPTPANRVSNRTSPKKVTWDRLTFYRPLLAFFLTIRAIVDLWSSMILEVWWLIASFAWGVYNLASSLDWPQKKATSNKDWTFGQIAPIILLVAPLLSVMEFLLGKLSFHIMYWNLMRKATEKPQKELSIAPQPSQAEQDSDVPSQIEEME